MNHLIPFFAAAVAISGLMGCKPDTSGLSTLTVREAASLLDADTPVSFCDANNAKTRRELGVLPGAILLTNYRDYDPAVELPDNATQQLVFYCYNDMCGSAVAAARKAIAAGRTRVSVMPGGITGWLESDQPVAMLTVQ